MICTLNCWFLESQMAQNKFSSWVKMLVNPLKPNVFNTHLPKMLNLRAKFYEFVLYYSMSTNPNLAFGKYFVIPHKKRERQIKQTRQTYPKKKPLFGLSEKTKWKPSSRSYKRAIRSTSIIIHIDWRLGKQLRNIFKKKDEKK